MQSKSSDQYFRASVRARVTVGMQAKSHALRHLCETKSKAVSALAEKPDRLRECIKPKMVRTGTICAQALQQLALGHQFGLDDDEKRDVIIKRRLSRLLFYSHTAASATIHANVGLTAPDELTLAGTLLKQVRTECR